MVFDLIEEIFLVLISAVLIDVMFGEPPNKIHPIVMVGRIINFFTKIVKKIIPEYTKRF